MVADDRRGLARTGAGAGEARVARSARRRGLARPLLAALLLAGVFGCSPSRQNEPRPDLTGSSLLLVTIDTLRADRLGAYGDERAATPTIDRLAAEGVSFANAYAPVPLTLPSHASMFTGRYPFELGVRNNGSYYLGEDATTLAELLEGAGYETAAFVSTYILGSKFGLAQGFDLYDDSLEGNELVRSFTSEVPADRLVERFVSWLAGTDSGTPFFAWLHFYDPHLPYLPPEPWASRFADDPYRGEIAFVDAQIGRALTALERVGRRADTLVAVVSDHGEAFGEHGEVGHGILAYDESLRVPLVFTGRSLPAGATIAERARLVDLTPTVLDLLGLESPPDLAGRTLVPLVSGGGEPARDVYFESVLGAEDFNWAPITGIIVADHKYISLPQPELYDLATDPQERDNLYRAQPELADRLDARLRSVLLATGDGQPSRRELSSEDLAHLRALGYIGGGERTATAIDPKQGIRIDQQMKDVRRLIDAGDLRSAESAAERLAGEHAELPMPGLFALRYEIATRRGDKARAVEILEAGLEALPESRRLLFLLAVELERSGDLDAAAAASRRLLALDPAFSQAHILLGRIAEARGEFAAAVARYEQALASEPLSTPLRIRHAEALVSAGAADRGLALLGELAGGGAFDDAPQQLYRVAMLHARAGDLATAERLFRRGLEVAPGGLHHLTFAMLLIERARPAEAVGHLETALEGFPADLTDEQRALARATLERLRAAPGER